MGGDWRQAPVVSIPESLPGSRCHAEYFTHLTSMHTHLSKVWIILFFYRLGNRLRGHGVTCPGVHSCQVAKQRLRLGVSDSKGHTRTFCLATAGDR